MRYTVLLFFLLRFSFTGYSQSRSLDSLENLYNSTKNDSLKTELAGKISQIYCSIDFDKALKYNSAQMALATKTGNDRKLADSYNVQGIIYVNQGKFVEADSSLHRALRLHIRNKNSKGIASAYGNLGAMYYMTGSYQLSLDAHLKCLRINEELNEPNGIAIALMNAANIYFIQKNYADANRYYYQCRDINHRIGNKHGEFAAINNIAVIHIEQRRPEKAIPYFDSIRRVTQDNLDEFSVEYAVALNGLGNAYRLQGQFQKARDYLFEALDLYEQQNNMYKKLEVFGNIAALYTKENNTAEGIPWCQKYLAMALSLNAKQHERDAYEYLADIYNTAKQYDKAILYTERFTALQDSLLNNQNLKNLSELQMKYETEKKEHENKLLIQQTQIQQLQIGRRNYLIGAIILFFLLLVILLLLFIRQNRLNAQHRSVMLEQKVLRSQMNPHFIFNSLTAIESYIYKNDAKEAGRFLSAFARLMRLILENSREEYIPLSREIQTLEHYLELQKNRFDDNFDYSIELENLSDPGSIAIPPMLAQPFIENSIEHGLRNSNKKGNIRIRFSMKGEELLFEVEDNGIGIGHSTFNTGQNRSHHSLATKITSERLAILNKRKKKKISLHSEEIKDPEGKVLGTKVHFAIPFIHV